MQNQIKMTQSQKRKAQSARSLFNHDILNQFKKNGWNINYTDRGRLIVAN